MGAVRSLLPFLFVFSAVSHAQMVVDPDTLPANFRSFSSRAGTERLQCRIQPVRANLNLGFRFQTGYQIEVPMKQYAGQSHALSMVLKVTPQNSERDPVWLATKIRLPAVPEKKAIAEFSGGYIVGEG